MFNFDKVINDSYSSAGSGCNKLYNSLVRSKVMQ